MNNIGEQVTGDEIQVGNNLYRSKTFSFGRVQALMDEADLDGDGQINYEEFFTMMNSCKF